MKIEMRKSVIPCFGVSLIMALIFMWTGIGLAASVKDLEKKVELLQKKVETFEKQQADNTKQIQEAKKEAVTKGSKNGTWKLPGTETEVSIGGYLKLDAIYSDKSAGSGSGGDESLYAPLIPVGSANGESDQLTMHARQSRLSVQTNTPTDWGNLKAHLEGDFFGSGGTQTVSNSYGFRLRHAYGQLGNLLAGQYWSTFMIAKALPETLDFGGPVASTFVRQAQIRWIQPFGWGALHLALENPETYLVANAGVVSDVTPDDDNFPDMIVRANFDTSFGQIDVAAMARQFSLDEGTIDESLWGGAMSVGGVIPTIGKDDIRFQLNYGNALGRYVNNGFAGVMVNPNTNELASYVQWGGFVAYRHFWRDNLRSTVAYSYGAAHNDSRYVPADTTKNTQSIHTNLIYSPVSQVDVGIEYIYASRRTEDCQDGDLNRIQGSVCYRFF